MLLEMAVEMTVQAPPAELSPIQFESLKAGERWTLQNSLKIWDRLTPVDWVRGSSVHVKSGSSVHVTLL